MKTTPEGQEDATAALDALRWRAVAHHLDSNDGGPCREAEDVIGILQSLRRSLAANVAKLANLQPAAAERDRYREALVGIRDRMTVGHSSSATRAVCREIVDTALAGDGDPDRLTADEAARFAEVVASEAATPPAPPEEPAPEPREGANDIVRHLQLFQRTDYKSRDCVREALRIAIAMASQPVPAPEPAPEPPCTNYKPTGYRSETWCLSCGNDHEPVPAPEPAPGFSPAERLNARTRQLGLPNNDENGTAGGYAVPAAEPHTWPPTARQRIEDAVEHPVVGPVVRDLVSLTFALNERPATEAAEVRVADACDLLVDSLLAFRDECARAARED